MEQSAATPSRPVNRAWPLFQLVVMAKNGNTKNRLSWWISWVRKRISGGGSSMPKSRSTLRRNRFSSISQTQLTSSRMAITLATRAPRSTRTKLATPEQKP
ncbi:hypothetical protein D3C84_916220 [compost metagenome]